MKKLLFLSLLMFGALNIHVPTVYAAGTAGCTGLDPSECPSGTTCDVTTGICQPTTQPPPLISPQTPSTNFVTQPSGSASQQGFTALAPIPGLTDQSATSVLNATTLANFFNKLYLYLIGVAAILAIIEIIWGGLEISTKESIPMKIKGRQRIWQAVLGLVLILMPYLIFSIINPSILNLSANIPAINLPGRSP